MFRFSGRFSRLMAAGACAALVSASAMAGPAKPSAPKSVPITIPLSFTPVVATGWSAADDRYEKRRHWKRHRHDDGIDGGDLLVGLLVLGGVAAAAGAFDKPDDEQRERVRNDYPEASYDYRGDGRGDDDWLGQQPSSSRAMDRAVEACSAEAGREGPIDEIYDVDRVGGEWRVRGDFRDGGEFTCNVDEDGRARVGIGAAADDRYATGEIPDFDDPRGR